MLAAAFSAFAPRTMPEAAAANANLFVSAENSQFQNYFAGPMVIEVVVIDSDIKDTDKGKGEPDVTVNGNKLRMVQATDGNWYGYFADKTQALRADAIQAAIGAGGIGDGLDFGTFCSRTTDFVAGDNTFFSQTVGVAFPFHHAANANFDSDGDKDATSSTIITASCDAPNIGGITNNGTAMNVLREAKAVNLGTVSVTGVKVGQIGLNSTSVGNDPSQTRRTGVINSIWPFIQLYNFNPTGNVVVQYNKGGGVQSTTLKFDTVEKFAKLDLDRTTPYPRSAQVHVTITDVQLNIDPTDEDSWTFGTQTTNATVFYGVFNEDGQLASVDGISRALTGNRTALMFKDNGLLTLNRGAQGTNIVDIQDNGDSILSGTNGFVDGGKTTINAASQPVTITESAPNTGIFGTYDEDDVSTLKITSDAPRGKSATINYNKVSKTILVGFGFATVDIKPTDAEWNSGEEIPVVITDSDANKNSRVDEDLDLNNPDVDLIPSLRIGNPFTLGVKGTEKDTKALAIYLQNFTESTGTFKSNMSPQTGTASILAYTPDNTDGKVGAGGSVYPALEGNMTVQKFSDRALITTNRTNSATALLIDTKATSQDLKKSIFDPRQTSTTLKNKFFGFNLVNLDIRGIQTFAITNSSVYLVNSTTPILTRQSGATGAEIEFTASAKLIPIAYNVKPQSLTLLNSTFGSSANNAKVYSNIFGGSTGRGIDGGGTTNIGFLVNFTRGNVTSTAPVVVDLFSFGYKGDGLAKADRVNNAIYRIEAEETGDNTGVFEGSLEYIMLNQLNILDASTYTGLRTIAEDPTFIVHQDLDDKDAPRVNYNDLGADGVVTPVADQQDAPTHSGVVSFDKPTYKIADTVVVTLEDQDLNVDSDLIDIYTVVNTDGDPANNMVGKAGLPKLSNGDLLGRLLDITFDDRPWVNGTATCMAELTKLGIDTALGATGFTLIETGVKTGIFRGDFQVPSKVCRPADAQTKAAADTSPVNTQGMDIEVNYLDFRDASGQMIEVGDSAGIRANTGSVSLDRTVYPVPWGSIDDFASSNAKDAAGRSIFPIHLTGITGSIDDPSETLGDGILTIHVQVNDPDFDTSASGEDKIAQNVTGTNRGPVKITVSRGQNSVILGYAGGDTIKNGVIDVDADNTGDGVSSVRQLGPITETAPSSGIFEFDLEIQYTDGPASTLCPKTTSFDSLKTPGTKGGVTERFDKAPSSGNYCILQGDIITVEYTDPADASGDVNTVTDSATFDLRNGVLQSDKSVYIIGSDMILTLIEPDFDLDSDLAETYDLDLIEWDSDAARLTIGDKGGESAAFDPEPSDLRETGDNTGIFQAVIEIPRVLKNNNLERGEEIVLEYTDWGPAGADFVGQEKEDINLTIFTSNFGATVELDQKVYTWTDKVYITVIAPDHNFDSNKIDQIGTTAGGDPLKIATRSHKLSNYKLVETGTDTGIFTGEVILTGFCHDADGKSSTGAGSGETCPVGSDTNPRTSGSGPTDGFLESSNSDGLTVSYEFSEDETVVGSALIRWNIGEVTWLEATYPASGTGVVRVIDPDMNLNPEAVDNFNVNVWSDSDAGGIDLTVTETNEATGIFEGTVFFTTTDSSSGHRLRVAEGDTVTAEYKDNTLPAPYTKADELNITGTAFIGTVVPPLERAPASNARVVDAFGNTLNKVSVDQQVQIAADLTNGQDREQPFAYLVQIQDDDGVTVSLAWITGSLSAGQSFSPALSWTPTAAGTYTATVFVWESVDNPTALSPPVEVTINVK
jgi:hypothetical protein